SGNRLGHGVRLPWPGLFPGPGPWKLLLGRRRRRRLLPGFRAYRPAHFLGYLRREYLFQVAEDGLLQRRIVDVGRLVLKPAFGGSGKLARALVVVRERCIGIDQLIQAAVERLRGQAQLDAMSDRDYIPASFGERPTALD